jgi:hypothetical protein
MSTDSGYSNQKKKGLAQFETVHNVGSGSYGKVSSTKSLYEIAPSASIVSVTDIKGSNGLVEFWNIEFTSHTAIVGNVLRIESGSLTNYEYEIVRVIDSNNFYILPTSDIQPIAGQTASILGWVTTKVGFDGSTSVSITSAPTQYNYNGSPQTVEQNTTTPANNRSLPALNFIYRNGVQVPIAKDTATPANTVGMPVEVVAASGTPINITAGDINVQLTDVGVNFDAVRLGDGTGNYVGVTASAEAKVNDASANTTLSAINTKTPALVSGNVPVAVASSVLPTGAATETTLGSVLTAVQLIDDTIATNGGAAVTKFVAVGGHTGVTSHAWHVDSSGLGRVDVRASVLPTGAATESTQTTQNTLIGIVTETAPASDTASSGLNGRLQRIAQRITSLIALLPTSLGQKTMAGSLAVALASDQSAVPVAEAVRTTSYQEIINLTTAAQTVTPPANSRWMKVYAEDTNVANIRVRLAGTATLTSGIQFQPGRSEDFDAVGTAISIIAESGTNQRINFTFGV